MPLLGVARLKPREIAVSVLQAQAHQGRYVESILESAIAQGDMTQADRHLAQELVYGVVRWQATLDWLIDRKTAHRTQKYLLQVLLRLGLYQMFWLDRIPAYAAIHETVELARQLGCGPQAGFLNAVLRGFDRERAQTRQLLDDLKRQQPSLGYSHPDWLCRRWEQAWDPVSLTALLEWNNTPPPTYARRNALKTDPDRLTALWAAEGVAFKPRAWDWTELGLVFELIAHPSLTQLPSFQQGLFYLQDPSTLLAVHLLGPQPGEAILDLCAAPGGKTTFIAQCLNNQGRLVASDVQPARLELLRANCARLGVTCVTFQTGPDLAPAGEAFDRVLLDVPCSNTGVLRRRVDLRWRLQPEESLRLQRVQIGLLERAAASVKPGGCLVYSTCSLEPEENQGVIGAFLQTQPGFVLETERALRPFADQVDGAYVARLRRTAETPLAEPANHSKTS